MFPFLKTKVSENDKGLFNFSRYIYQNEIYNFPKIKRKVVTVSVLTWFIFIFEI